MTRHRRLIAVFALAGLFMAAFAPSSSGTEGIDVSRWQGEVDWNRVESAGIRFAFVKATQGAREVDPRLERNWSGLGRTKIVRGAYHFLEPDVDGAVHDDEAYVDLVRYLITQGANVHHVADDQGARRRRAT